MPLVLNFVLLSLAGLLVGAALRATRLRAPKPLIRALHAFSLVALALALALAVSLARSSGPRSHPAARSAPSPALEQHPARGNDPPRARAGDEDSLASPCAGRDGGDRNARMR